MNLYFFVVLLAVLQFFYWFVGKRSSTQLKTSEDYFLAGKNVRFFPLMMTFLATQVGGGLVLGAADEAYKFGWTVLLYPLGAALGLMWLGAGLGKRLAAFQISTVAQIFEEVYGSFWLKKIASLLSIISLFMILVAQIIASFKFLMSLGLDQPVFFVAFWAVVILYTVKGGLRAVIATDIIQALLFAFVFLGCLAWVYFTAPGALIEASWRVGSGFESVSSKMCGWLFMPLLFMVIEQDMGQRCFAGDSGKIVSKAAFWAGVGTLLICIAPVFFGTLAKSMHVSVVPGGSVLMASVEATLGPWISAVMGCAILAAVISTATSLMNAIGSNLSNDFQFRWLRSLGEIRLVRAMTAGISSMAIVCAFYFDSIVDLLIQSYELSVSCLFASIFIALFRKKGGVLSAWISVCFGALGFGATRWIDFGLPKEIISVAASFAGYGLGELMGSFVQAGRSRSRPLV